MRKEEFEDLSKIIRKQTDNAAIIMGDFNYGEISWETMEATAEEFLEMIVADTNEMKVR